MLYCVKPPHPHPGLCTHTQTHTNSIWGCISSVWNTWMLKLMYLHLSHTHTSTFTGLAVKAIRTRCCFYTHIFTHFWQLHYVFMYLIFIQYELCSYWKRFQCHHGLCSFMWMIMLNTTSWRFSTFCLLLDSRGEVLWSCLNCATDYTHHVCWFKRYLCNSRNERKWR